MRQRRAYAIILPLIVLAGCSRPPGLFSEQNASAHVRMLAGTIGSRPAGTEPNARARAYIIDQLRLFGFDVRVQETDARRPEFGYTARVANIVATLPGSRSEAIGLLSHYDSRADTPGAGDNAFGVAVSLEAARVLAARPQRPWSLFVLVTDAEEAGLMGAAAMMTDKEITDRVRAYLNIEAVGSEGPAMLFETGPGNGWLLGPWARRAPHPRGASFGIEIYRRLPNDTDFTMFGRHEIPGLNFALVGDSYAYHTPLDTPDRLSTRALREAGENVVATVSALDSLDITYRSPTQATFFDIGGTVGVSYGPTIGWILTAGGLFLGILAWVKVTAASVRMGGPWRWLLTFIWSILGALIVVAAMIGVTWALRAAREVYHPWYARPDRLFFLIAATGVTVGWSISRIGQWFPAYAHGMRHPAVTWSVTLPLWIALAAAALWFAPAAAYLWMLPLFTAGTLLLIVPAESGVAIRLASILVLAVAATLWLRESLELARFLVAVLGRMPIVTPVFIYAAVLALSATMVIPPLVAAIAATRPLLRPSLMTALLLIVTVAAAGLAYAAPAYTPEQPLRRYARAVQEAGAATATWEVASTEPGLDLGEGAPSGWSLQASPIASTLPVGRLTYPFVFRVAGPSLGPAPVEVRELVVTPLEAGTEVMVTAVPARPGLTVSFVLPPGLVGARSSLPGVQRQGRWTATYAAVPMEGITWRASVAEVDPERLRQLSVVVTEPGFPGGDGWQRLPGWLPRERTVWASASTWIVPAGTSRPLEPVPPLR